MATTPEQIIGKLEKRIAKIFGLREYVPALEAELQPLGDLIRAAQAVTRAGAINLKFEGADRLPVIHGLGKVIELREALNALDKLAGD
jgi:hypothetical protein